MKCLQDESISHIIAWLDHGKAFIIKDEQAFCKHVLPKYFGKATLFRSFKRKLNRWGFRIQDRGMETGIYQHPSFLRGHYQQLHAMKGQHEQKPPKQQASGAPPLSSKDKETPDQHQPRQDDAGSCQSSLDDTTRFQEIFVKEFQRLLLLQQQAPNEGAALLAGVSSSTAQQQQDILSSILLIQQSLTNPSSLSTPLSAAAGFTSCGVDPAAAAASTTSSMIWWAHYLQTLCQQQQAQQQQQQQQSAYALANAIMPYLELPPANKPPSSSKTTTAAIASISSRPQE